MHGLINRSIQLFLSDTYGPRLWTAVAADGCIGADGFEAMLLYDDSLTERMIGAASVRLAKPRAALLEDFGIYLVSLNPLRRLLRFCGSDYTDFLGSLDDLPGRARLAVSDLALPELAVRSDGDGKLMVAVREGWDGYVFVMAGVLRAMADDYGALALIDADAAGRTVRVDLAEARFAEARRFELAVGKL